MSKSFVIQRKYILRYTIEVKKNTSTTKKSPEQSVRHSKKSSQQNKKILLTFAALPIMFFATTGVLAVIQNISQQKIQNVVTLKDTSTHTHSIHPIDLTIAQYSDTHITQNAMETNQQFSHLSVRDFLPELQEPTSPQGQIANVGSSISPTTQNEYSTWIWTPLMTMSDAYIDSTLKSAHENNINVIYLSIDSYLDIYVLPDGADKNLKEKAFADRLEQFIMHAHAHDIDVDAEAGWRNWAELGNTYKAFAVVAFAEKFNATHTQKLRGFQYDVEPYLLSWYTQDSTSVYTNFLDLISQTEDLLAQSDLRFSVTIPDFYDVTSPTSPAFNYRNTTSDAYTHLLDILQNRPKSSVIVMSYRNFANGSNGSIDISNGEIQTATNGMYTTKVIIAQETGDVQPPYITFHNTSKNYLDEQIEKINTAFMPYQNFGGVAVHYINSYLELK
jgi:hypothetical protein